MFSSWIINSIRIFSHQTFAWRFTKYSMSCADPLGKTRSSMLISIKNIQVYLLSVGLSSDCCWLLLQIDPQCKINSIRWMWSFYGYWQARRSDNKHYYVLQWTVSREQINICMLFSMFYFFGAETKKKKNVKVPLIEIA